MGAPSFPVSDPPRCIRTLREGASRRDPGALRLAARREPRPPIGRLPSRLTAASRPPIGWRSPAPASPAAPPPGGDHDAVVHHDFRSFAERELSSQRTELGYPPFGRLVLIRFEGEDATRTQAAARACADAMRSAAPRDVAILGPALAPLIRLRGHYRWHVLLRGRNGKTLRRIAATARAGQHRRRDIRITLDVDPQNLL